MAAERILGIAVGLALGLRLALIGLAWWSQGAAAFQAPDSATYLAPAESLVTRLEFADAFGRPELFRTPGYPLLLAAGVLTGRPLAVALTANLALAALLVILSFRLARRLGGGERVAMLCALGVAVEPTLVLWSVKVLPETLFSVLLVAFALSLVRTLESRTPGRVAAAAAVLAAAIYVKPIAYPLVFITAGFLLLAGGDPLRARLRTAAVLLLTCAALLVPWHVRNSLATGYLGFSTLAEHALYLSVGGSIAARQEHAPYSNVRQRLIARAHEEAVATRYSFMRTQGLAAWRTDPLGYLATHAQGVARTALDPGAVEYLRLFGFYPETGGALVRVVDRGLIAGSREWARERPVAYWSSLALLPVSVGLMAAAVVGAGSRRLRSSLGIVLPALLAGYFLLAGGGVPGSSRFRVPAIPFLLILGTRLLQDRARRTLPAPGAAHTLQR